MDERWEEALSHITQDWVIGLDDAGTGAWAGGVYACAVLAPKSWTLEGLNDSKKLSKKRREAMLEALNAEYDQERIAYAIFQRSNKTIDQSGIQEALAGAFMDAIEAMATKVEEWGTDVPTVLLDGGKPYPASPLAQMEVEGNWYPKGDNFIPTVMAASILAKTSRDEWITTISQSWPQYGWDKNMGYGTKEHRLALEKYGCSPLHRMSYKPMKSMVGC